MRQITKADIERVVGAMVQPMFSGAITAMNGMFATLTGVIPFGTGNQNYRQAFPFGFVSSPVSGVMAYLLNLQGSALAPVILSHLDKMRPTPSGPGETILYCLSPDGSQIPCKITLGNDGTTKIELMTALEVICDSIKLGSAASAQALILGNLFMILYNAHSHTGNLGIPTGNPLIPMDSTYLSSKAFTEL